MLEVKSIKSLDKAKQKGRKTLTRRANVLVPFEIKMLAESFMQQMNEWTPSL
jgi:hypothetical protein